MSRGPGTRQREILRRLQQVRCLYLPDLWHGLRGEPDKPWPNPAYPGSYFMSIGQSLALYDRSAPRSVKVAYRRAVSTLQLAGKIEVRPRESPTGRMLVRLPMTEGEKIATRGLRRRVAAFQASYGTSRKVPSRLGDLGQEREQALAQEYRAVMDYFWDIDRIPPPINVPPRAARILRGDQIATVIRP